MISLIVSLWEVFSGYFEPTNVLYIEKGSHNSNSFYQQIYDTDMSKPG